jgi:glutathione peroxidase
MRILFFIITACLINQSVKAQSTVYGFQLDSLAGANKINFSAFTGKKILIINTASLDSNAAQYADLRSLNQFFKDSLVIVAIPSNSFGTETGSNSAISSFYTQENNNRFPVASKTEVTGANMHPLYAWLTQQSLNGVSNSSVMHGFRKYLINRQGQLVGVFSHKTRPNSKIVMNAISSIQ